MKIMKHIKSLQLLLLCVLLCMPMLLRAQDDENPIVLELYCYGQVTASIAEGQSARGVVCATESSSAPESGASDWNTKVAKSEQQLQIRQNNVAPIMAALQSLGIEMTIGPSTYATIASMGANPLYVHASSVVKDGYYFEGWKDKKGVLVSEEPSFAVSDGWNVRAAAPYGEGPYGEGEPKEYSEMGPFYASFPNLVIGEPYGDLIIHPTDKNTTYNHSITIPVPHADSKGDVTVSGITSKTGSGTWSNIKSTWDCANDYVTINYTFNGNDNAGVSKGQIVVSSKGGESQRVITLQARFANIASGNAPMVVCSRNATVNATATFATQYVESRSIDFPSLPTFSDKSGGTWNVTGHTYANNQVTVNYSFTAPNTEGTYTANLTLTTSAGVSRTIPCTIIVEDAASSDALVYDANGGNLTPDGKTLAEAITYANATATAATISLRRDVALDAALPAITRSITLDLRGKKITNAMTSRTPSLTVGDGSSAPTVTLTDSRVDGKVSHEASVAGEIVTVDVVKGKLIVASGKVEAKNISSDASASAVALNILSDAQAELQAACEITATATMNNAVGIWNAGTLTVKNGTVTATAAAKAKSMDISGTATLHAGTFTATATGAEATGVQVGENAMLTIKGGTITSSASSSSYAVYSKGTTTIEKAELAANATSASVAAYAFCQNGVGKTAEIQGGKYKATAAGYAVANVCQQAGILHISGGIYADNTNLAALATASVRNLNPSSSDYTSGYRYAVGNHPNAAVAQIGDMYFPSLTSALSYVNNNPNLVVTIILKDDESLQAGKYTLPANATLLIPYNDEQTAINEHPAGETAYTTPTCFRTLTLEAGARLDIYGKLQVGSEQVAQGQLGGNNGVPTGSYAKIAMQNGSAMTVESGSHLYAWGFIVGQGTIDVKRGGTVHEMMQIKDWRGGQATFNFNDNMYKVFPLNQYYIQNIEVPATFRPGSKELIDGLVNAMGMTFPFTDVLLIGANGQKCMFSMDLEDISDDTWVRKWYDAEHDKQVYDINNSAQVSSLLLTLNVAGFMSVTFNSALYVLPLTNNMKIHLLTGTLAITQDVLLTPGAEIEVDKEATAYIVEGKKLFVMDADDWMPFSDNVNIYPVSYSPSWTNGCPRHRNDVLDDAKINVHGTFRVDGTIFTTEHGANIFSSNADAGTFLINNAAPTEDDEVYLANNTLSSNQNAPNYQKRVAVPALLRNWDATFAETRGAEDGRTYAYYNNQWRNWRTEGCFAVERVGNEDIYYAKPADYVALVAGEPNAADHLYHSADQTRTFILMDGCQWWEVSKVENEDDLYYCAKNNVYYFYDEAAETPQWKEKLLTVRWLDSDGSELQVYKVHYGDKAQYFHDDPSKPADGYKTYDFIGWLPEPAEHLTSDASYVAQYQENIKECTIIFRGTDGELIEQSQVKIGDIPVCVGAPAGIGELYDWYPPIHAVTADEEYMLVAREVKEMYSITFLDWNNRTLLSIDDVPANKGISTSKTGEDYYLSIEGEEDPIQFEHNPNKPNNGGHQYTFIGWSPALGQVTADAIYTAQYKETVQKFAITLEASNGGSVAANTAGTGANNNEYEYGTILTLTATPNTGYYLQKWQDDLVADSRQITVTGNATYTATFSNVYNVALFTNGGSILANGRSTYTYSENATPLPDRDDLEYDTRTALGWYTKADFSGEPTWAIPARSAKNLVFYLKWSEEQPVEPEPQGETFNDKDAYHDANLGGYYSTFYSSVSNYLVPAGYTAYKAVIEGEYIRLRAIGDIIPAGEGVLLYSETVSAFDLVPTNDEAAAIGQNDFRGTDDGVEAADLYVAGGTPYVFSAVDNVVGFYKLRSTANVPAHKAYVLWSNGNSAPPRMFRLDRPAGVTTDINNMESEPVRQKGIYSILGHKLNEPVRGTVNVIDGELKFIP